MIFSNEAIFSDDQAITADAASTNIIDMGVAADLGKGVPMPILVQVTEAFNNLTSLKVTLQVDDNASFSSAKDVQSATMVLADLTQGAQFPFNYVPQGTDERYWRLNYDVTGTAPTTGKVVAGLTMGNQSNNI
ncbi:MAG: hypothetical protein DRP45_08715 [Candidatus Zixiibacteriota bacterium]|nr:MAG: hypothetical protein DRP45_08715 [candidate division Zixibacteria bacterium]